MHQFLCLKKKRILMKICLMVNVIITRCSITKTILYYYMKSVQFHTMKSFSNKYLEALLMYSNA